MSRSDSRPSLRTVLLQAGYRRLWAARTASQCGDVLQFTTTALLVLHLTGSGVGVSGVVIAEVAAVLLLAPLAGPLVDRLPRVGVMIVSDLVRMGLAAVLAVTHHNVAVVYVVAFGLSAGAAFSNPAAASLLPALVRDDQLVAANGGIWSAAVLCQVALAPIAGVLAATVGFGPAFAVNAASFLLSAVLLSGLRCDEQARPVPATGLWKAGREGLRLLRDDRLLRALAIAQALAALSAGATSALLVVLAARRLASGGAGFGLMLGAIGVGAVCGPALLRRSSPQPGAVFGAFALRGLVDLSLAVVTQLPVALLALALYGVGTSVGNISFSSLLQRRVPAELRGRVFSAFDLIWQVTRLLSLLLGGLLVDHGGIRAVFFAGGGLLLAAAIAGRWTGAGTRQA